MGWDGYAKQNNGNVHAVKLLFLPFISFSLLYRKVLEGNVLVTVRLTGYPPHLMEVAFLVRAAAGYLQEE